MRRSIVMFVSAMAVVGASLGLAGRGSSGHAAEAAQIAFGRDLGSLYLVQSDGTGEHPTTIPQDAVWSHDGRSIVFSTESLRARGYLIRVFVASGDGSHRRQIAKHSNGERCWASPTWSPDDTRIAYTVGCDWDSIDLYLAGRSGHARLLARGWNYKNSYWAVLPSWSPDGRTIVAAHSGGSDREWHLVLLDPSGRSRRMIPGSSLQLGGKPLPSRWSLDSQWIYFVDDAPGTLYVIGRDGHGRKALSPNGLDVQSFDLSPDGTQIAFTGVDQSGGQPPRRVYVMSASGADVHQLTNGRRDRDPAWSPDGRLLAFTHENRIAVMNADGSAQHDVSSGTSDGQARWVPGT